MAQVIPHPMVRLAEYREIVANADLHDDAAVLDACEALMTYGDSLDCQRARMLRDAITRGAVDEINRRGRWGILIGRLALLTLACVAAAATVAGVAPQLFF